MRFFDLTAAQRMVHNAASDRVDTLLKNWRDQIESDYQLILKAGEKLREDDDSARRLIQQQQQQQAMDAALDGAVADYLESLLNKAQSVDVSAIIIPGGRSISGFSGGALAEISALSSAVMRENVENDGSGISIDGQGSALKALEKGLVPHPGDLSMIQQQMKIDAAYALMFSQISTDVERLDSTSFKHPRLKVETGLQRLNLLRDYGDALNAYGSDRLVSLVSRPEMLVGVPTPALPMRNQAKGTMPAKEFNQMLSGLFAKPKS